jgi:hypothetical protein
VAGSCEHGDEPLVSIKGKEFLDKLSDYYLVKKDFAPWGQFNFDVYRVQGNSFSLHCPLCSLLSLPKTKSIIWLYILVVLFLLIQHLICIGYK